jgi:putative flippase GtrA
MPIYEYSFFKFILVGIINTLVGGILIFVLYNKAGLDYWLSSALSYILGSCASFFLNKYFTFMKKEWNLFMIITFVINIVICYGIAYGIAKPMMDYLLKDNPQKIRENVALVTGICLFTGLNYFGQRFIVFKSNNRRKENEV